MSTPICTVKATVQFSPYAPVFVAAYDSANAKLFSADDGEELFTFTGARRICGVYFLPDEKHVVLAEQYHAVGVYSLSDGKRIGKKWTTKKKGDELSAFLPVKSLDKIIYAAGYGGLAILDDECQMLQTVQISGHKPHNVSIHQAALSPDESRLAIAWTTCHPLEIKRCLSVFEWPSMEQLSGLDHFMQRPNSPSFHGTIKFLNNTDLYVSDEEASAVFDSSTGNEISPFPGIDNDIPFYVHVRSPHSIESVTNENGKLVFRDTTIREVTREIDIQCDWIVTSISSDERRVALASRSGNNVCALEAMSR